MGSDESLSAPHDSLGSRTSVTGATGSVQADGLHPWRRSDHPVIIRGADKDLGELTLIQAGGERGGGSVTSLRGLKMRRQDMEKNRPLGNSGDTQQGTLVTTRTAVHVDGKYALEQTSPAPSRRDWAGGRFDPPLAGRWSDGPSQCAVRGQTTRISHLVYPWRRGPMMTTSLSL